jgi:hypothetical protein
VQRAIAAHLESEQVARVIYGAIIGLALVVALEAHPPRPGVMAGTMIGTAVAVGLAEAYSEAVGAEVRHRRRVAREQLRHIAVQALAVGFGVAFPTIFFVLAAAGAMEVETAFTVAKWTGLGVIGFYGFCAARLAGAGVAGAFLQAAAVAVIGALLIALKALVH